MAFEIFSSSYYQRKGLGKHNNLSEMGQRGKAFVEGDIRDSGDATLKLIASFS